MKILITINVFLILYICTCMNKNIEKMSDTTYEKNKTLFIVSESNGKVLQCDPYNYAKFDNTNRLEWERMTIVQEDNI